MLPCGPCVQGIGHFYFTTDASNISAEATVSSTAADPADTTLVSSADTTATSSTLLVGSSSGSAANASTGYCPAGDRQADGCFSAWHGYQLKQGQVSAEAKEQDPLVRRFVGFGTNMVVGGLLLHQVGCFVTVTEALNDLPCIVEWPAMATGWVATICGTSI